MLSALLWCDIDYYFTFDFLRKVSAWNISAYVFCVCYLDVNMLYRQSHAHQVFGSYQRGCDWLLKCMHCVILECECTDNGLHYTLT